MILKVRSDGLWIIKDGSVVHGMEPEFEECETVADSFEDFMEKVMSGRIRI